MATADFNTDLIITGVIDGPLSGGVPKAIELFALNDIADLSVYGVGSANNGGGSDGEEFTFSDGSATAGEYIYVASEAPGFTSFFGFSPDFTGSAANINGDDAIELFFNGTVVDTFGEIDVDGTGQPWEYLDGWTYRESGTGPDGETFVLDNWTFSGPNALDGETTNATAATPFPIASFDGNGGGTPSIVINEVDADTPGSDAAEFVELFDGGVGNTSLDGLSVVFFNGSDDASYEAFDLDGFSTNADGFFVLGNPGVANVDLVFEPGGSGALQNGADAVALYQADATDFPNDTPVTTTDLIDAIVYDTSDADDAGLLTGLGQDSQFNENANGSSDTESNSRVPDGTGTFVAQAPTPGALNEPPVMVLEVPIFDIQGDGDDFTDEFYASPFVGQQVTTEGVVTALAPFGAGDNDAGFFIQDASGDGNDDTSDGIFVFTGSSPITVEVGDSIEVVGTVAESFGFTRIESVLDIEVVGTGSIDPIVLGVDRIAPTEIVDDAGSTDYDVTRDGRDFYESLEGMLVTLPDAVAVSLTRTFSSGSVGEFYAIADGTGATGANARGGITIAADDSADNPIGADLNPERLQIDNDLATNSFVEAVEVGDSFGDITGPINFAFNDYAISPLAPVAIETPSNNELETTDLVGTDDQLTIATFNVLNLDPGDPDSKFTDLGSQIANNLQAPDIIALQEVQDNNGPTNNGVTAADQTLEELVDAIAAAGGPTYDFVDNEFFFDGQVGGQPGANIRVAFLYNSDRVNLIPDSVGAINEAGEFVQDPTTFFGTRVPLVADFDFNGEDVTVVGNHFSSKGGSDPLFGEDQPPENGSLDERNAQAGAVNDFVASELAADPDANIVALGDFNEFQFFEPLEILEQNLANLTETLPETERYTFNFEGNSQALDHVLVTADLAANAEYDAVHVNTEFAGAPSDHDPAVARFTLESANQAPIAVDDTAEIDLDRQTAVTIDVLANDSDPDGDDLSVDAFDAEATLGVVTDNGDGTFDYDTNGQFAFLAAGESATDAFAYTITDGEAFDTADVTITVFGPENLTNSGTAFSFSQGTNGGANTFGFDGDSFFISGQGVSGRPRFQDFDNLLRAAAGVFDGVIERTGNINDQALPGGNGPNNIRVNDNDEVIISGRGIGGTYRIQFVGASEAETFRDFVDTILGEIDANNAVATDPTDFRFDAGDARLFFDEVNDEFGFTTDGGATQTRFDNLEEFVEGIAIDVFGGEQLRDGNFNAARIAGGQIPNGIRVTGGDDVVISGRSVGGRFQFGFADAGVAGDFVSAASTLFGNVDEANAIAFGDA